MATNEKNEIFQATFSWIKVCFPQQAFQISAACSEDTELLLLDGNSTFIKELINVAVIINNSILINEKLGSKQVHEKPCQPSPEKYLRLDASVLWNDFCKIVDDVCRTVDVQWPNVRSDSVDWEINGADSGDNTYLLQKRENGMANLLCLAVHKFNTNRSTYISKIMSLDHNDQIEIMKIIEQGLLPFKPLSCDSSEGSIKNTIRDEKGTSMNEDDTISTNQTRYCPSVNAGISISEYYFKDSDSLSPSRKIGSLAQNVRLILSPSKMTVFTPRSRIAAMHIEKETIEALEKKDMLQKSLAASIKREFELDAQVEKLKSRSRENSLKDEMASMEKENELREKYSIDLVELRNKLEKAELKLVDLTETNLELQKTADEADILRHAALKLGATEEQLRRTKNRLEEYSDIKDQLIREEVAHGKAIDRILQMEAEVSEFLPIKRQLEIYKTRATDAEVKLCDCQDELKKVQNHFKKLKELNATLVSGSDMNRKEVEKMLKKVASEATSSKQNEALYSVGSGMSELNPELSEEMARLRNENDAMNNLVSKHSRESVQKLEESLDDSQRLSERYKKQFLTTKSSLERVQSNLTDEKSVTKMLHTKLESSTKKSDILQENLAEEKQNFLHEQERSSVELSSTKSRLNELGRTKLDQVVTKLTQAIRKERQTACTNVMVLTAAFNAYMDGSSLSRIKLVENHRQDIKRCSDSFSNDMRSLKLQFHEDINLLQLSATKERNSLIIKGKSMMANKLAKADESKRSDLAKIKASFKEYEAKMLVYEENAKSKIASCKRQLNVSMSKCAQFEADNDELQTHIQQQEKELNEANEDNNRLRRQMTSRAGCTSDVENRHNNLQKEYTILMEENRRLKRDGLVGINTTFDGPNGRNVSFDGPNSNGATIMQVRSEYERVVDKLNFEKRDLVVQSSSAYSDIQKAEQRSWQLEEELKKVKDENVTLRLAIERTHEAPPLDNSFESHSHRSSDVSVSRSILSDVSSKIRGKDNVLSSASRSKIGLSNQESPKEKESLQNPFPVDACNNENTKPECIQS
mmetsp:Transcript_41406/g.81141  ORF Transcript_41406/g.81141 Transcript_41406/m.81141 type:complete len:1042 (-) Transcript_41406:69-3194(-)